MQGMLQRYLQQDLFQTLSRVPAVVLLGPRQVGKTTLAKKIGREFDSIYLDLEAPDDLAKLQDPTTFLRAHQDQLVILDEIQLAPEIFPILRGLIDHNRERGRRAGHYLLLGSASMDLMRQSSESLAGRISYLDMTSLSVAEIGTAQSEQTKLWVRGGFPDSFLAETDEFAMRWLEDLIRTYLERDVPKMGFRVPAVKLRRLWTMMAHLQGETVNMSKIGDNFDLDAKTISHYIDILVDLLLGRRLEPWHANVKKRVIKSPRYYVRDSGILHRLLSISDYDPLLSNPVLGKSWEGFVLENIHIVLPRGGQTYFYRTAAGAEIDLVIQMPNGDVWAIEVKHSLAPKLGKHFNETCEDIGATHKFVVYSGDDEFGIGNDVQVISLRRMLDRLMSR